MFRFLRTLLVLCVVLSGAAQAAPLPHAKVVLGDEVFLSGAWHELNARCVGVVTNQTGVTSRLVNIVDAIRANGRICIKAIYSPEHGLRGDRAAGAFVESYTDSRSGLPVYSLYGKQRHPNAQMLDGVDVLLFDIQDVGSRTYTYVSTMAYVMEAAKQYGKEVWILDRPNPIGGTVVEGPVLDPKYKSFIGLYPIAMRHGMTVGELARMFNDEFGIAAHLRVIAMQGYNRKMLWPDTGLEWVQTSPNMPEWSTAIVYPCTGLLDKVGLSPGIGTTRPFKYVGAQNIDAYALADRLNARDLPGVFFRPNYWTPFFGDLKDKQVAGVELVITDPYVFRAVPTAVEITTALRATTPSAVHVDKGLSTDWGTDTFGNAISAGESTSEIEAQWQPGLTHFLSIRKKYLLY